MSEFGVALLTETWHPELGGGERQARLLAHALRDRGHAVTVITRRSRRELPAVESDDGVRVLRVPPAARGHLAKWGLLFTAARPLRQNARAFDVLLVSGFRVLGVPAVRVGRALGRPVVLKADSSGELSGEFFRPGLARFAMTPESRPVRSLLGRRNALLRHADAFVALSDEIAAEFRGAGVPADRIRRVPNAVDDSLFRPASDDEKRELRRRLGLPDGPVAVFVGRLVRYKGLFTLLRAWRDLGGEATLVIVGGTTDDVHGCEPQLRAFVEANGMQSSVRFAGPVPNVEDWLRAADLFAFPTENEAFGLALAEAMACALPVIATPVGGVADSLHDGGNALIVAPGDAEALLGSVRRLLADGALRARLGAAARDTAHRTFALDAVTTGWIALFEELLSTGAGRR